MFELTGFKRDMLTVVAGLDRPNGLDIKADLKDYYESEINHGRLYPNLDDLVDEGLLEKRKKDERTNEYLLAESGKEALKQRRSWEEQYVDFE